MKKSEIRQIIREELKTYAFIDHQIAESATKVDEGWGTLKVFAGLYSQIRKDEKALNKLANRRPTEQIAWLKKTYGLSTEDARSMRKHLAPYIRDAAAKIPIQ